MQKMREVSVSSDAACVKGVRLMLQTPAACIEELFFLP